MDLTWFVIPRILDFMIIMLFFYVYEHGVLL
jgi:hypothetical protein